MAAEALSRAARFLRTRYASQASGAVVLEAGAGSFSHFPLPPGACLIALDISIGQLARNTTATGLVCADLHALPVQANTLDAVFCFNVIEHLERPDAVLPQLCRALKIGGMLLLGYPERASLKGWVTRLTPLGFHRWYYRRIVGKADRGEGHFDSFPTVFHALVDSGRLAKALTALGMHVVYCDRYDGAGEYRIVTGSSLRRAFSLPYYLLGAFLTLVSAGRWRALASDAILIAVRVGDFSDG